MSSDFTVYLAGAIDHAENYGRGWRDNIKKSSSLTFLNPLDQHDPATLEAGETFDPSRIVSEDISLIDDSDALFVKWDIFTPMCGTPMEISYAYYMKNIPIVVWCPDLQRGGITHDDLSPWLRYHSSLIASFASDGIIELFEIQSDLDPTVDHDDYESVIA